jgi:hypothetical protein
VNDVNPFNTERILVGLRASAAVLLTCISLSPAFAAPDPPSPITEFGTVRVESRPVPGGGELYTYFGNESASGSSRDIPFLSILRDTLGDSDPTNDRLREVWAFTYGRPSVWKRLAAGIPFLYRRAGWRNVSDKTAPQPVIDLAAPAHGTGQKIAAALVQATVLDPLGIPWRAPTRAYRGRTDEYRMMHVWNAMSVLSEDTASGRVSPLSSQDLDLIQGRLLLSSRMLGGLVDARYAEEAWRKERARISQSRAGNWELLRQRAEENHLYFEPLHMLADGPAFALLWVAQPDAQRCPPLSFDAQFLGGIANPFRDVRVKNWKGYSELWMLDGNGSEVDENTPGAHPVRMVPLALYGLEYPKVPLLLIDFRDSSRPKRHEMIRRVSDDIATSILGFTGFGHWPYLAAKSGFFFVHGRRGGVLNRDSRIRSYARLRHALTIDDTLPTELRTELARRLDELGVNPLEDSLKDEASIAKKQYAALVRKADSGALARDLDRQRGREIRTLAHSASTRAGLTAASVLTMGLYQHHEQLTPERLAEVDRMRRFAWNRDFLERILAAGPDPDVVANMAAVRRSLRELSDIGQECASCRMVAEGLVTRVLSNTKDEGIRAECAECLEILGGRGVSSGSASSLAPATHTRLSAGTAQ